MGWREGMHGMEGRAKQVAELLKLLANENRLMIFCALLDGPKTVTEIGRHVPGITQSALSQHLKLLKAHGVLTDQLREVDGHPAYEARTRVVQFLRARLG